MENDYRDRLAAYRTAMALASAMFAEGIITKSDYEKVDGIIADKYGLSSSCIFCRYPLIKQAFRGNMLHTEGGDIHGTDDKKG